jgi:hypothetical protein
MFWWPERPGTTSYELKLTGQGGFQMVRSADRNYLFLEQPIPPGTYSWTVRPRGGDESEPRDLAIPAESAPLIVPTVEVLLDKAKRTARPRSLPAGTQQQTWREQHRKRGAARLEGLTKNLESQTRAPLPAAPRQGDATWPAAGGACSKTQSAGVGWLLTGRDDLFEEMRRRAVGLADWDAQGPTSLARDDQAAREIAVTMSLVYDWGYDRLSGEDKRRIREAVKARASDLYADLRNHSLLRFPFDSHRAASLGHLAVLGALWAGEMPEADSWFSYAVPLFFQLHSPWGGDDGGAGNGTGYGIWDIGIALFQWDILERVTGVDLTRKSWEHNFGRYMIYFLPPGTPSGMFGDGAEDRRQEVWARYAKAYAARVPLPEYRWYAEQQKGEAVADSMLLLTPVGAEVAPQAPDWPASALFPSIGWVAMHSSLVDPDRTSVYFKSSPFGGFNHSHLDQNSFVINARRTKLAIDSGYYDSYAAPHWTKWAKLTKAHNAITYDGGMGQRWEDMDAFGRITHFQRGNGFDVVAGDATAAYGPDFRQVTRWLVYVRPDTVVVFDVIKAVSQHIWEWNLHAVNRMLQGPDQEIKIENGQASLCTKIAADQALSFSQTDAFDVDPKKPGFARQWHGRYSTKERSASTMFAAVLQIGCGGQPVKFESRAGRGWVVNVGRVQITLDGDTVAVQ